MTRQCSERTRLTGKKGSMNTAPSTRSGCTVASKRARCAPRERLTMNARSTPLPSSTATASRMNSSSVYASSLVGRSDLPLPRGSKVRTRDRRAKSGICAFQQREWTIDQVGRRRIAGSPWPQDSQCTRTPSRSTKPTASGSRARDCSRLPALALANVLSDTLASAWPITLPSFQGLDPSVDPSEERLVPLPDPGKALEHVAERERLHHRGHCLHRQLLLHAVVAHRPAEGLPQHRAPLGVHRRDARRELGPVPGQRLKLEPDLRVAGGQILFLEPPGGPPLLQEGHVRRVHRPLPRDQPLGEAVENPEHDLLERAEVVVDQALVGPRLRGERPGGHSGVAHPHQ